MLNGQDSEEYISLREAAQESKLKQVTLRTQVRHGRITAILHQGPNGPSYRIKRSDLEQYLQSRRPGNRRPAEAIPQPLGTPNERVRALQVASVTTLATQTSATADAADRTAMTAKFQEFRVLEEILQVVRGVLPLIDQEIHTGNSSTITGIYDCRGVPLSSCTSNGAKVILWLLRTGQFVEQRRVGTVNGWTSSFVHMSTKEIVDYYPLRQIIGVLENKLQKNLEDNQQRSADAKARMTFATKLAVALGAVLVDAQQGARPKG